MQGRVYSARNTFQFFTIPMAKCKKPVERLWISSMTDQAIRQGFQNLKPSSAYAS